MSYDDNKVRVECKTVDERAEKMKVDNNFISLSIRNRCLMELYNLRVRLPLT